MQVHGVPDPELKWYYIDDAGNVTSLTDDEHGWIECRGGEVDGFARLSLYNNSWKESSEVIERIIVRSHLMAVETITAVFYCFSAPSFLAFNLMRSSCELEFCTNF